MSIKISIDKKTFDRRQSLWERFGKVTTKGKEFLNTFDWRVYLLGLDALENGSDPKFIETKKKPPAEGTRCIIEYKGEVCVSFFEDNQFNTTKGSFKLEDVLQWYPYPNNFK